ncbi:MAG: type III-A CRISPR-associated protein Cas10/Csm1 [Desulfobacterium sp.]|nr:type III-A CRISPR-associated protein Cas10/Csm1 [Desulfobacterium sp.]
MNKTTLKIAMAAFFHDLGKFIDPRMLELPAGYADKNAGVFLPSFNGKYSHWHALYTAGFIEKASPHLPSELNTGNFGDGDAFIRLAAAHHDPSSVMEWIVALADRISSGMDRETFDRESTQSVQFKDYKTTRLLPVFEHMILDDDPEPLTAEKCSFRYPLKPLTAESIFPVEQASNLPTNRASAAAEYQALTKEFLAQMERLAHMETNTALWFEHFDSLVKEYTWAVPAARVGKVIPDVSLYDHLRTTAAIAAAIYLFHADSDTLEPGAVQNLGDEKFLLISGSFSGIQNFIFSSGGESAKYRSKIMRGRSFYVSLLSEFAAQLLCKKIGLPHTSVIFNAGGRFTLLAPKTDKAVSALAAAEKEINDWLVARTFGETSMVFSSVAAKSRDFESTHFSALWERLVKAGDEKKYSRLDLANYGGAVEDYLDRFCNDLSSAVCQLCGKRPAGRNISVHELPCCALCRDHVFIGENLVKHPYLFITEKDAGFSGKRLFDPVFDKFQLYFSKDDPAGISGSSAILKYWCLDAGQADSDFARVTHRHLNGYVPVYSSTDQGDDAESGMPKTLNDLAAAAATNGQGVEALGVLKADVDNLGLLMACGLRKHLYTVSRMACISRQMDHFFSLFLPDFLLNSEKFQNIYTVFAGGDDLFLIGPWNCIIELSRVLENKFKAYVCQNENITFSAGITLHKPHTPINTLAKASEEALDRSKYGGRKRITLFGHTVPWPVFKELDAIRDELHQWTADQWISLVFLYRINFFIAMAEQEKLLITSSQEGIPLDQMNCTQWRAKLAYSLERSNLPGVDPGQKKERLNHIREKVAMWLTVYGGDLRIALWTLQYSLRKENRNG